MPKKKYNVVYMLNRARELRASAPSESLCEYYNHECYRLEKELMDSGINPDPESINSVEFKTLHGAYSDTPEIQELAERLYNFMKFDEEQRIIS